MLGTFEINPTFSFTLLGTCAIYAATCPTRAAWASVLGIALALRLVIVRVTGGLGAYYGVWWISWGAFLGIASLVVIAGEMVRTRSQNELRYKILREAFYAGAVFPLFSLMLGYTLAWTTRASPKTLDNFLLAFDGSLGLQPSFLLGSAFDKAPNWWGPTTIVYYALPFIVSILYSSYLAAQWNGRRPPIAFLSLFISLMIAGFSLYTLFPAVGPAHAFHGAYPRHALSLSQIPMLHIAVGDAPRNCMPSLHLAGALAIFWNRRLWPRWARILAGIFLWLTVFSTLALGEHYLIDLVVAVPFTLVFQAVWTARLAKNQSSRYRAMIGGTVLWIGWLVALRFGLHWFLISPVIPWLAMVLTVTWCWGAERDLRKALSETLVIPARETVSA